MVSAIPPLMLKTPANPVGTPIDVFNQLRAGVQADRSKFWKDQIVPIAAAALQSSKLVKGATLKVIKGAPHGMCTTLKDQVNEELVSFFKR